jgi:hypothetical protein
MGMNQTGPRPAHEVRDMSVGAVALFAVGLAITLILVHFAASGMYRYFASRPSHYPPGSPLAVTKEQFAGPHLLVNQSLDMEKFLAVEDVALHSYGWMDRDHGVVHIPIDRAMELLVQSGSLTNITTQGVQP